MRLLIITQKVDRADPILGFFHRWIERFATHCESVTVIGQFVGEYDFPANVHVYSLGKEDKLFRWRQIIRFWNYQLILNKKYDTVLVHMTPIWVVLGAPIWKLLQKKIHLWYEVRRGRWYLPIALRLVRHVFSATTHGLPNPCKKQCVLGHGIDIDFFKPNAVKKEKGLIVTVGRITPVKHLDIVIRAFAALPQTCRLVIAGDAFIDRDKQEKKKLVFLIAELGIADRVQIGFMQHGEIQSLLQRAELFLHACEGGLDKVILEAMASGCLVLSTSVSAKDVLPEQCTATFNSFTERTQALLNLSAEEQAFISNNLRTTVEQQHSLVNLIEQMCRQM